MRHPLILLLLSILLTSCAEESQPNPTSAPSVVTTEVSEISPTTAVVHSVITMAESVSSSYFLLKMGDITIDSVGVLPKGNTLTAQLTGLQDTTAYSVTAILHNGSGQRITGKPAYFTTLKTPDPIPEILSTTVTDISTSSAYVSAQITNSEYVTAASFDLFRDTVSIGQIPATIQDDRMTAALTNLEDTTIYRISAVVMNKSGKVIRGGTVSFVTLKIPDPVPEIISTAVSDITISSAAVSARVKNYEYVTEAYVELVRDGILIADYNASMKDDILCAQMVNLSDTTEYQVTAVVKNKEGKIIKGEEVTFTTLKKPDPVPEIISTAVSDITISSAAVSAKVKNYEYVTEAYVELVREDMLIARFTASMKDDILSTELANLSDTTEYQVTAVVKNKEGNTIKGEKVTFTTLRRPDPVPEITSTSVSEITLSSASVSARVKNYEYVTEAYVELVMDDMLIARFTASMADDILSTELANLSDTTEYQVTAVVKNKEGKTIRGEKVTFTTLKKRDLHQESHRITE